MPQRQSSQVAWIEEFTTTIMANPSAYGLSVEQTSAMGELWDTLSAAWAVSQNTSTRTKVSILAKDDALRAAKVGARNLVSVIQGIPTVSDTLKAAAGLTVRKKHPTRKPAPGQSPFIKIKSTRNRTAVIELQQDAERRGKPENVTSATVFLYEGTNPPPAGSQWTFYANVNTPTFTMDFGASDTGGTVWVTAFWQNAKSQSGPAADPVRLVLPAWGVVPAKSVKTPTLKAA
jgi:hypothetical protein